MQSNYLPSSTLAAAMILAASAARCLATVAVSNVRPFANEDFLNFSPLALSFTTAAEPATLDSITVRVQPHLTSFGSGQTFAVSLWSDAAGHPDSPLESYPAQFTQLSSALLTYTSPGLPLDPHTTYWVVYDAALPGVGGSWSGTTSFTETSDYGWTIGNVLLLGGPNSAWVRFDPSEITQMSINATLLPDPTFPPAAAITSLTLLRRRRQGERDALSLT
jgi:hypothetical protein